MAKVGLVFFYVASLVVYTLFSLALGLNIVLVPAAIVVGWSVGAAARRANCWSCPKCKEEMIAPEVTHSPGFTEPSRTPVPRAT